MRRLPRVEWTLSNPAGWVVVQRTLYSNVLVYVGRVLITFYARPSRRLRAPHAMWRRVLLPRIVLFRPTDPPHHPECEVVDWPVPNGGRVTLRYFCHPDCPRRTM